MCKIVKKAVNTANGLCALLNVLFFDNPLHTDKPSPTAEAYPVVFGVKTVEWMLPIFIPKIYHKMFITTKVYRV